MTIVQYLGFPQLKARLWLRFVYLNVLNVNQHLSNLMNEFWYPFTLNEEIFIRKNTKYDSSHEKFVWTRRPCEVESICMCNNNYNYTYFYQSTREREKKIVSWRKIFNHKLLYPIRSRRAYHSFTSFSSRISITRRIPPSIRYETKHPISCYI